MMRAIVKIKKQKKIRKIKDFIPLNLEKKRIMNINLIMVKEEPKKKFKCGIKYKSLY